ncbi:MAG: stage II sporulation protein R [Clostridia bacterium]|nr:stage II sporulation protein R [Clostridia bacterium]
MKTKRKQGGKLFYIAVAVIAGALTIVTVLALLTPAAYLLIPKADAKGEEVYSPAADGEVLRLHILANSDSERDLAVKLAVRDAVLAYERENSALFGTETASAAENALLSDGSGLLSAVRTALRGQGAEYDAQLMLGEFDFPDREYAGKLYPAGRYRALRILLGRGEGQNWWCIMFPPLCLINDVGPAAGAAAKDPTEPAGEACFHPVRFESFFLKLWNYIIGGNINESEA